ncbi:MAG: hypothetical protein U5L04_04730 [Trueperaceae bacterium]|nr:hypothetical protein [Trueperaceae bacterium]
MKISMWQIHQRCRHRLPDLFRAARLPLLQRLIQPSGVRQVAGLRGGDVVTQALGVDEAGLEQGDRGQIGAGLRARNR